jgi:hypothetical protein
MLRISTAAYSGVRFQNLSAVFGFAAFLEEKHRKLNVIVRDGDNDRRGSVRRGKIQVGFESTSNRAIDRLPSRAANKRGLIAPEGAGTARDL